MMYTGVIKWYNPIRGFGFIAPDDGKEMVYADNQKLIGIYRHSLVVGTKVRFNLEHGQVGCQATNIVVLNIGFD
ncbi:cold shock domain-containing protein [Pedobacter sp. ISL-68]|uniref:cold-shock protein n=1 Tax=Pedobacter sp. ISL-68 TaxID=2819165 RepID=UPI001BEB687B|nr:cold shock domain-containing protein [Pedobacter sp. ISL-68]MBT2591217.1 cold shock domain-containing protein [Pedobacter sp. ISL-68]